MEFFFRIYMFLLFLTFIPVWVSLIPLILLTIVCVRFWKQVAIRNVCIVIGILIAIPFLGKQVFDPTVGRIRLKTHFGRSITADSIVHYRFRLAGLGDTMDFWEFNTDTNNCQKIIKKFGLKKRAHDRLSPPGSLMNAPSWWPKSPEAYSIFEGSNVYHHIELWIPTHGYSVYLYKFTE